ncbi:hypothetical protein [uncultured Clostridium sp.]|uniref:hypothetical protein n=1 Tax=uncultured Clostridium sp. TaxID=59620 RepID=UPI0026363AAB|nr:hypothetical protein [uncultured Clostridium sp.]
MGNENLTIYDLLSFFKRWGIVIIIIAIIVGYGGHKYLVKPKYSNTVLLGLTDTDTSGAVGKIKKSHYYTMISGVDLLMRMKVFQNDIAGGLQGQSMAKVNKGINIIQNPENMTFTIQYTSENKSEINNILDAYSNKIIEIMKKGYCYSIHKISLGKLSEVNSEIYTVIYSMIGIIFGILVSAFLDMIIFKGRKSGGKE